MALTDIICRTAKVKEKDYKLSDSDGMYLLVKASGAKCWCLKYRIGGKEKKLSMGVYPSLTLQEAREARAKARKLIEAGIDPSQVKKDERRLATLKVQNSFEAIAREWHDNNKESWTVGHAHDIMRRLEYHIFPSLGRRPIADITALELLDTIKKIEKRGTHHIAHRILQSCRKVFQYAILTCRADRNPAIDLAGALKPSIQSHYSALDIKELPEFLQCLERNDARLYMQTRLAIKLMLLTFVRTGELINATWGEFNLDNAEWIIPAERMKMRRPHVVPLSKQALEILKELKSLNGDVPFVFPGQVNPKQTMSNNTILFALKRMGYQGKMTGHGFRALAMSAIKEQLGYRHEVVDRQLAHAPANKIIAAYDRAKFLDERKKMMQEWADYISALVATANAKVA